MAAASPLVQALNAELAKYPALDPKAVLAVSAQEGLGGGIGDGGTSFGPFQLHYGGAYPSWAPQGEQASQQWATSPQGLDYALRNIAGVAGGLKGAPAVENIVSRFERPANPGNEIAGALRAYGGPLPASAAPLTYPTGGGSPGVSPAASHGPAPVGKALASPILAALVRYVLGPHS